MFNYMRETINYILQQLFCYQRLESFTLETTIDYSLRAGCQGVFTASPVSKGSLIHLNVEEYEIQDPLFPIEQLLSVDQRIFEQLFKRSLEEYEKSRSSSLYNIKKHDNMFKLLHDCHPRTELIIRKGESYWILETLRRLPEELYEAWAKVVSHRTLDNTVKEVLENVEWRLYFLQHNPGMEKHMPVLNIPY